MLKSELDEELKVYEDLLSKIRANAGLDENEVDLTEELFNDLIGKLKSQWKDQRIRDITDILFPNYDGRQPEENCPIRWPGPTHWWWNGVSIKNTRELENGDFKIDLKTYTGGGEYDTLNGFIIKAEWLNQENLKEFLHDLCRKEMARLKVISDANDLAQATRDLAAAQEAVAKAQSKLGR